MADPGRLCPLTYRTSADDIADAWTGSAETLYVVGGLYGNRFALDALVAMAAEEAALGLPPPLLVFNGDFNWFNAERETFCQVNHEVLAHLAIAGNVELELANPTSEAGCGCAYPDWVSQAVVDRSNLIMERLQRVANDETAIRRRLGALPRHLRIHVGSLRIGVLHGDPDAIAGWGLAIENLPAPGMASSAIRDWFEGAEVDVLACTHTCVAYMQNFPLSRSAGLVMNNGSAGMPNFTGDQRGLISRISTSPSPTAPVVGCTLDGVYCDAIPFDWDQRAWQAWFEDVWPAGSAAHSSYGHRICDGPDHRQQDADRLTQCPGVGLRPSSTR